MSAAKRKRSTKAERPNPTDDSKRLRLVLMAYDRPLRRYAGVPGFSCRINVGSDDDLPDLWLTVENAVVEYVNQRRAARGDEPLPAPERKPTGG